MEMLKVINPITTDRRKNRKLQRAYISEVSFITVIYLLTIKGGGEKCNCNFIMFILSIFHLCQRVQTLFGMLTDMTS